MGRQAESPRVARADSASRRSGGNSKSGLLLLETVQLIAIVVGPLVVARALSIDDTALFAVLTGIVVYVVDIGSGRRGSVPNTVGAAAVLMIASLAANYLKPWPLLVALYLLALVFVGTVAALGGPFWGMVGFGVPVGMTILSFAVSEVSQPEFVVLGTVAGAVWATLVCVVAQLLRPPPPPKVAPDPPPSPDAMRRTLLVLAAKRTLAMTLALLIGMLGAVDRPYWIMLTVLVVLQPASSASVDRSLRYGVGTVAGVIASLVGFALFGVATPWTEITLLVLILGMVFASQIDYGLQTAFSTAVVLTLLSAFVETDVSFFAERLLDVMAGIGIALTVEYSLRNVGKDSG